MERLKGQYAVLATNVIAANKQLAGTGISIAELFLKKHASLHRSKIGGFYDELSQLDQNYSAFFQIQGSVNDLQYRNAQMNVVSLARAMATGGINDYQSNLRQYESQVEFRLNMLVALLAVIVSAIGVAV